ncbi:MAG: nucleotidyltransferase domain-containing protein [bacterium]
MTVSQLHTRFDQEFQSFVSRLIAEFKPNQVVWFGSRVAGRHHAWSDYDLLIVMPYVGSPIDQAIRIAEAIPYMCPLEMIVRTPEYLAERLAEDDPFYGEILATGRVLHEAPG